jgi:hypothetical protein
MKKISLIAGVGVLFLVYYLMNNILLALLTALAVAFILEHYTFPIVELSSDAMPHPNQIWNLLGQNAYKESTSVAIANPRVIYEADRLAATLLKSINEQQEDEEAKKLAEEVKKVLSEGKFDLIYGVDASSTLPSLVAVVALRPIIDGKFYPINACLSPMPSFSLSNIFSVFSLPSYDIFCSRILEVGSVDYETTEGTKTTAYTYVVIPATPKPLPEETDKDLKNASRWVVESMQVIKELMSTNWRLKTDNEVNQVNLGALNAMKSLVADLTATMQEMGRSLLTSRPMNKKEYLEALKPEERVVVTPLPTILIFILLGALLGSFYGSLNYSYYNMTVANAYFTFAFIGSLIGAVAYFIYTKIKEARE